MRLPLFVYGTLLNAVVLARKSGDPRLPGRTRRAWVEGLQRARRHADTTRAWPG